MEYRRRIGMKYLLKCSKVVLENEIANDYYISIEDELIKSVSKSSDCNCHIIDLSNYTVLPGLIDLHIHGANGYDTMDGSYHSLNEISKFLAKYGVTSFLPTTLTASMDRIEKAIVSVREAMEKEVRGAEILGLYLEGPYLTEEHKGAHPIEFMRPLKIEEIKALLQLSSKTIKIIAIAPEKEHFNELAAYLKSEHIKIAIGHTNATYDEAMNAFDLGATIGVHTFNGMRSLHHREPGATGAILNHDNVYAELIADNIHVHPAVINLLYKLKGSKKMYIVSDCIRAAGLDDGEYILGELKVTVKDALARIDTGSLAGSTLKLIEGIKNIMDATGIDLLEAVKMATITPAKALGIDQSIGSIKAGKKANITVIDNNFNVVLTIVNGKIVFKHTSMDSLAY